MQLFNANVSTISRVIEEDDGPEYNALAIFMAISSYISSWSVPPYFVRTSSIRVADKDATAVPLSYGP